MIRSEDSDLTKGGLLAKNTVLNVIGQILPLAVAFFSIPILVEKLGLDRFGLLTLCWIGLGYFSLFDLGLGRVIVKIVAEKLGTGDRQGIPEVVWSSMALMGLFGLCGALILYVTAPFLVNDVFNMAEALEAEAVSAFRLLAFGIPVVITMAGCRGLLEAYQRFDITNTIQACMGVFTYLGPLVVLPFSNSIVWVISILLVGRGLSLLAFLILCVRVCPELSRFTKVRRSILPRLIRVGTWMTVSNIISPIMVYLDRFLIGALVSVTAVSYYATSYEVVSRVWLLPEAIVQVLFPAMSFLFMKDKVRTTQLYAQGLKFILLFVAPAVLLIFTFAHEGITFWLGQDFADNSFYIMQIMVVGVLLNSLARVPYNLIQGAEKPEYTAFIHLFELPAFLGALWWLSSEFGVAGAAAAWTARMGMDWILLMIAAGKVLPETKKASLQSFLMTLGFGLILVLCNGFEFWGYRAVAVLLVCTLGGLAFWKRLLSPQERDFATEIVKRGKQFVGVRGVT